jgi:hypothetical protein
VSEPTSGSLYDGWDPPRPGWTCAECQFDFDATALSSIPTLVTQAGPRYQRPLTRGLAGEDLVAVLRTKPSPTTWSALEYAAHVRDCLRLYDQRIARALSEERPEFPAMRRDEVAVDRAYNDQDPARVAEELGMAAEALATRLDGLDHGEWERSGVRAGEVLTVSWMARNVVHECAHHLLDIGRVLRQARGR